MGKARLINGVRNPYIIIPTIMFRKALLFFIEVLRLLETSGSFLQSPENFSGLKSLS